MEIHRQRFSQLNPRFKRQQRTTVATFLQPVEQPVICPVILPSASRPQPRQGARSKQHQQTHFPPAQPIRRPSTVHVKHQQSQPVESNHQYITLANLTKILHVLQTNVKVSDSEASIETHTSTTNSAKQRVQQHLQETATRWWRPIRSSDSHPVSSIIHTSDTSTAFQQYSDENNQLQKKFPLLVKIKFCYFFIILFFLLDNRLKFNSKNEYIFNKW
jgi:hypothetical protein